MNYLADFERENLGVEYMTACPDKVLIIIFGGLRPTILWIQPPKCHAHTHFQIYLKH